MPPGAVDLRVDRPPKTSQIRGGGGYPERYNQNYATSTLQKVMIKKNNRLVRSEH